MPKDIYDFAYPSRRVALHPTRNRPVLLDNDRGTSLSALFARFGCGATVLPREAWESARVA